MKLQGTLPPCCMPPGPWSLGGGDVGDGEDDGGEGEEEVALDGGLLVASGWAPRGRRDPPWLRWVAWPVPCPEPWPWRWWPLAGWPRCAEWPVIDPDMSSSPPESQRYTFLTLRVVPKPSWCERSVPKLSRGIRCWA